MDTTLSSIDIIDNALRAVEKRFEEGRMQGARSAAPETYQ